MAQWDGLTWWEQRLYIEGLNDEFGGEGGTGTSGTRDVDRLVFSNRPGELARVGFTERNLS